MPGQWTSIETNFPTFTGKEPVEEKISQLLNYMFILTDQLKYNLSNLNATNFNAVALKTLTENTSSEAAALIAKDLEGITAQYAQLNARVANMSSTLAGLQGRVTDVESELAVLSEAQKKTEGRLLQLEQDVPLLEEKISGEYGLGDRMEAAETAVADLQADNDETGQRLGTVEESLQRLSGAVVAGENTVTVGGENKAVHLVGQIYINGVLYGQEEGT